MRRWLLKIVIAFVCLLLLAAAAVQGVLWSDWPRRIALSQIEQQTGLAISAGALESGWFGQTVLRNVTVSLPLADQPFAEFSSMHVQHTPLLAMLFGRMDIEHIQADQPYIRLVQDQSGEWNVQRMIEVVTDRIGGRADGASTPPALPEVEITNAQVTLATSAGETISLPPVQFHGQPQGALVWQFNGDVPGLLQVQGRVSTGGTWRHEASFQVRNAQDVLKAFMAENLPESISAQGSWQGQIANGQLSGRLDLQNAQLNDASISGRLSISTGESVFTAGDLDLTLTKPDAPISPLRVVGGSARWQNATLHVDHVQLLAPDVSVRVNGTLNNTLRNVTIEAQWNGRIEEHAVAHHGVLRASVDWPTLGQRRVVASIQSEGNGFDGQWAADLEATATGATWTQMQAQLNWPKLTWRDATHRIDLSELRFTAQADWPLLKLSNLYLPNAQTQGAGEFNTQSKRWSLKLAIERWQLPITSPDLNLNPIELKLDAFGDSTRVDLASFSLVTDALQVTANGTYDAQHSTPITGQALAVVRLAPVASSLPVPFVALAATSPMSAPASPLKPSTLQASINVQGQAQPLALVVSGSFTGVNVPVASGTLDEINMPVHGTMNEKLINLKANDVKLLGGTFDLDATYTRQRDMVDVQVQADELSLRQLAVLLASPVELDGSVGATAHVRLPPLDPANLTVLNGLWHAVDIRHPGGTIPKARGHARLDGNVLQLTDSYLASADEVGSITGSATFDPKVHRLSVLMQVNDWPLQAPAANAAFKINGKADLDVDMASKRIYGSTDLTSHVLLDGSDFGTVRAVASIHDRTVHLTQFDSELLNGSVHGNGTIFMDKWVESKGQFEWAEIDLEMIAEFIPALKTLQGKVTGTATIEPAVATRAPGPMRIHVATQTIDASSRSISIGDADVTAYAGPWLVVVERANLQVADGEIDLWGRLSWHGTEPYALVHGDYKRLDLNQFAQWTESGVEEVPGRISGSASVGGYLFQSDRLFGQGSAQLEESDLAHIDAIALIHNALSLQIGEMEPTGYGTASFRVEGDSLELARMEYFNRGADIVASARIENMWLGERSPISGVAVGAIRPLKNINLPFFNDLDRAMKALQTGAASVHINGTVGDVQEKLVPFAEISAAFNRIFGGPQN